VSWLGLLAGDTGDLPRSAALLHEAGEIVRDIDARGRLAGLLEMLAKTAFAAGQAAIACQLRAAASVQRDVLFKVYYVSRDELERDLAAIQASLPSDTFATQWAAGRHLSWDRALTLLLTVASELMRGDQPSRSRAPEPWQGREVGFDLTKREREILVLLTQRLTDPEIAERLFISRKTVGKHVSNILGKLGASTRREAAALAARYVLV
jgi:DNA-binding CsgD family transcriptional regulator